MEKKIYLCDHCKKEFAWHEQVLSVTIGNPFAAYGYFIFCGYPCLAAWAINKNEGL